MKLIPQSQRYAKNFKNIYNMKKLRIALKRALLRLMPKDVFYVNIDGVPSRIICYKIRGKYWKTRIVKGDIYTPVNQDYFSKYLGLKESL